MAICMLVNVYIKCVNSTGNMMTSGNMMMRDFLVLNDNMIASF